MNHPRRSAAFLSLVLASCAAPETFRFDAPGPHSWVALPLRVENDRPYVDLEVNGHPLAALFDLGAGATVWLEPAAAEAAGARFTGGAGTWVDAFGKEHAGRRFVLGTCRAGEFEFRDVEGREAAVSMVGWRLLQRFRVLVDYPGGRVVLATGTALPPDVDADRWVRVPFRATGSGVVTDATVNGREMELVWDTGASRSILKPGRGNGPCALSLGGHDFGTEEFTALDIAEPPGDGLVGQPFFQRHRVLIDWETGILSIEDTGR